MGNKLTNRNIIRLFLTLLPIQIFIQISSSLASLINGSIVGNNLSAVDMSSLGLITPYLTAIGATASIFSGGLGIVCGNLMGKGEKEKIDDAYSICLNTAAVFGLLLIILTFILRTPLAKVFGANIELLDSTVSYLTAVSFGVIPIFLLPSLMTFLQMSNKSNFTLLATILLAIFNAVFDIIGIKFTTLGVYGIGLASSISYYLVVLVTLIYIRKNKLVRYNLRSHDFEQLKKIIVYGLPFALANILYAIRNVYMNNLITTIGGIIAVNAMAIVSSISGIVDSFNIGIGAAYRMLASVYIGERDSGSLKRLFTNGFIISEIIIVIKVLIMFAFAGLIARAFGATGETILMTVKLIKYYAMSSPFNILTIFMLSTSLTLGRSLYCNIMYLINAIIIPFICFTVLPDMIGIDGVFCVYYVAEIFTLVAIFGYIFIKHKTVRLNFNELFDLPADFEEGEKLTISINSIDEVINTSIKVEDFCIKNHLDNKLSKYAGLCIEEMAGNIIDHGFNKDKKKHSIDIFVLVKNDDVLIRIKDDCVGFDPNTRAKIFNPDDPCKNVGIRLISKLAKSMNYQSTFGMNVLTLTI